MARYNEYLKPTMSDIEVFRCAFASCYRFIEFVVSCAGSVLFAVCCILIESYWVKEGIIIFYPLFLKVRGVIIAEMKHHCVVLCRIRFYLPSCST